VIESETLSPLGPEISCKISQRLFFKQKFWNGLQILRSSNILSVLNFLSLCPYEHHTLTHPSHFLGSKSDWRGGGTGGRQKTGRL